MYIRSIKLENVRGFDTLDFRLDGPSANPFAGWTVITGDNGSGKTTLLKAVALALVGPDSARTLQPSFKGWLAEGSESATIAVEIVAEGNDRFAQGRTYRKPFWSEYSLKAANGSDVVLDLSNKYRKKGLGPFHGPWADSPQGWYSAGYGPFRRLYGASSDAQRIMSGPGRVARFVTIFYEDATLGECELWLKELKYKNLEGRSREGSVLKYVQDVLNNNFLHNNFRIDRIDSEGIWLRDEDGLVLPLREMSDGYRAALATLCDILRHMIDVYATDGQGLQFDPAIGVDFPGIVLIDEVDAHLHPEWQRQIGFWLKRVFPKVQFIVTTHSALICQAADEEKIYNLGTNSPNTPPFRLNAEQYWNIIRSKPNEILLSPAFGMTQILSPLAFEKRKEYARLSAKKAQRKLNESETDKLKQLMLFVDPDEDQE